MTLYSGSFFVLVCFLGVYVGLCRCGVLVLGLNSRSLRHGHITVSTVGVIGNMHKLTADMPNISLALSLHAPTQEIREIIVPTAKAHPLPRLLEALDRHLANCKKKSSNAATVQKKNILKRS